MVTICYNKLMPNTLSFHDGSAASDQMAQKEIVHDFTPTVIYGAPYQPRHEAAPNPGEPDIRYYNQALATYETVIKDYGRHSEEAAMVRAYVALNFPDKPQLS